MKAKKIIIPIIIVLVILTALGGTFAFLWFKTDLFNKFKPSKDVFANQLKVAVDANKIDLTEYSEVLDNYKFLSDKSVKSSFNITANINSSNLDKDVQNTINKSKISIESQNDVKHNNMQSKIGLYSTNNSEVLTVDMVKNGKTIGIGCKDIYDKYLALTTEDFIDYLKEEENMSENDLKILSKTLSGNSLNIYDLLYISKDDINHFDEEYSVDKMLELISKDCFSKDNKKTEVEVDGETVKVSGSYLTLNGPDAYSFLEDIINKYKNDSVLSRIITEKANIVLDYYGKDKMTESDVKKLLNDSLDEFLEGMESLKDEEDSAIQIAIYSKNNKPQRIDFNTIKDIDDLDDKETIMSIEYADQKTICTMYNDDGEANMKITNEYEKKEKNEYKGKLTIDNNGSTELTLDYEIVIKDSESKIYLNFNIPYIDVKGKVDITTKGNIKNEAVKVNGLISIKFGEESGEVKFDGTIECTEDLNIPELTSSNSLNVLKLSKDESDAESDKILKKASEVLPDRLKLIGVNIDASSIYTPKEAETTDTDVN